MSVWNGLLAQGRAGYESIRRTLENPRVARYRKPAHYGFIALIVGLLFFRLHEIGWGAVLSSLPASPLFYVFFLAKFLALPLADTASYSILWRRPLLRHLPAFIRKRVYNYGVAGYSGDAFLAMWASRTLGFTFKTALIGVKDGNILSAFTANFTTVALIAGLAATGMLATTARVLPGGYGVFAVAFAVAATVLASVVILRRKILHVAAAAAAQILGVHALRQIAQIVCTTGMYASAIPGAPAAAWLLFIALQLVVSRAPFLPNQDLVYLTAALSIASVVNAPEGAVAGMLLTEAALVQGLNVVLFFATAHLARIREAAS